MYASSNRACLLGRYGSAWSEPENLLEHSGIVASAGRVPRTEFLTATRPHSKNAVTLIEINDLTFSNRNISPGVAIGISSPTEDHTFDNFVAFSYSQASLA
jgi:hypothetical protein